jgi:hypothetical protein
VHQKIFAFQYRLNKRTAEAVSSVDFKPLFFEDTFGSVTAHFLHLAARVKFILGISTDE